MHEKSVCFATKLCLFLYAYCIALFCKGKLPLQSQPHLSILQCCPGLRLHQRSLIYINQSVKTWPTGILCDERRVSAGVLEECDEHTFSR